MRNFITLITVLQSNYTQNFYSKNCDKNLRKVHRTRRLIFAYELRYLPIDCRAKSLEICVSLKFYLSSVRNRLSGVSSCNIQDVARTTLNWLESNVNYSSSSWLLYYFFFGIGRELPTAILCF